MCQEGFASLTVGTVFGNRYAIRFYAREGFQQEAILQPRSALQPSDLVHQHIPARPAQPVHGSKREVREGLVL
jgi:hypothetical protein